MMHANIERYDSFLSSLRAPSSSTWTEAQESVLLEPYTYITANTGKKTTEKLVQAFNLWLNVPKDKLAVIIRVVGLFHNAGLLVDDIEDDSQLRRGITVAHKVYGIPRTINAANYVYFLAYQELSSLRPKVQRRACDSSAGSDSGLRDDSFTAENPDFSKRLISDRDLDLVDILWRDTLRCPTEDEYVQMVKDSRSSSLSIRNHFEHGYSETGMTMSLCPILIGIYYQIRDDYMNLQSDEYTGTKGFAEDLSEGKFSFPVVHGILDQPENQLIIDVLQKRPETPTLKHRAIEYLRDTTKSFDYTLAVLHKLEQQARGEVERLGGNPILSALLDKLHVDA
ncbi:isoprenoid synthase domain-containing protein [Suillus discolor]|uniref:(2E,6E)-farnesyl diphosphate synthase n=1 Tax=Suillus discolor TaxID=1912936 RepID=A0A9P7F1G7_9AGAM|nr:isoprenoid synthase domain-containing protein [Suillus discolor]KAG2101021.1 isoprenoid synthase domain-containing protein [Suillus discolor]